MAFYAGRIMRDLAMKNPTAVVLTNRNDLDDQLFSTFSRCADLLGLPPAQAKSQLSATASPRLGNAGAPRVARRSTRKRCPPLRNSSRLDCHPLGPQNSSALAGPRLTESQRRGGDVETEAIRPLSSPWLKVAF